MSGFSADVTDIGRKSRSMAGPTASAQHADLTSLSLPSIGPVHSTPSKKSSMRKKLSRIGLPFSSSEEPENEYVDSNISIEQPTGNYTPADDCQMPNSTGASLANPELSSPVHSAVLPNGMSDTASSNAAARNNASFSKFNNSTSSLTNSVATPPHKLPYKTPTANLSSSNVHHPKQQQQQQNSTSLFSRKPESLSNSVNNAKSISFHHTSSPNKPSSRYLATNNDHTFVISRGGNNNQQHPILPAPQTSAQRPSHSQMNSVNYVNDDTVLSSSNSSTNNNTSAIPKIIPLSHLPQFTPVNQAHHQSQNSSAVLAPPTVLTPAYKTHSSSTQGTGQHIYASANNSSIMYSNHNNESNSQTVPSVSDTNSTASRQKRGTGLLQHAYRSSHQSHSNLANSKNKEGQASANNTINLTVNNNGKLDGSHPDGINCLDSKFHFISPKISNQFKSLQHLIQLGIKKRLEYLDNENSALLSEITNYYDEIENVQKQLSSQVSDLDGFIATLTSRKEVDLKNLQQHGLFENLNDLNARIETVKGNMDLKKESLKMFEIKLNTLAKLKINNENRDRNRKHIAFVSSLILALLFLMKLLLF